MKYTQEENVVFTQGGDEMEDDLLKIEEGKEEEEEEKEFKIAMIVQCPLERQESPFERQESPCEREEKEKGLCRQESPKAEPDVKCR